MGVFFFFFGRKRRGKNKREEKRKTHTTHRHHNWRREKEEGSIKRLWFLLQNRYFLFFSSHRIESSHSHTLSHWYNTYPSLALRLGSARAPTRASVCGVIGVAMPMPVWLNLTRKGARDDAVWLLGLIVCLIS